MILWREMPDKDTIFTEMLNQYEKLAFSICYKMTGNYFDAEDLTQETFLSIYKSLDSFDGNNPGGFVTKTAVNKCLDFLKRADRRAVPTEENILLGNVSSVPPPEEEVVQEETKRELMRACNTLKPPYNQVATDYYCNGMTAARIAEITGKKLKTVQTQIRRAKEMIRRKARKEGII
ncbi:MAG: sigma-70 family RNA polymerase sigma factor [Lachnospiraceae bacterium]|nr:sigma-70 family RNA polymerase sigma factor [Lachnospiraceae bacterium]